MKNWKTMVVLIFAFAGIFSGCAEKAGAENADLYSSTTFMEYENKGFYQKPMAEIINDVVYYSDEAGRLQCVDQNGENAGIVVILTEQEGELVDIGVSSYDVPVLLTGVEKETASEYCIFEVAEGKCKKLCDLKLEQQLSAKEVMVTEEIIGIHTVDGELLFFDRQGNLKSTEQEPPCGQTVCLWNNSFFVGELKDTVLQVSRFGPENETPETGANIKVNHQGFGVELVSDGKDFCYITDDVYVSEYYEENGLTEPLLKWSNVGINPGVTDKKMVFSDGSLLWASLDQSTQRVSMKVIKLNDNPNGVTEQNLVLATVSPSTFVEQQVIVFNESNREYRILIKDYGVYEDPYTALRMDIIAGEPFDILCLENMPVDVLIDKGLLADLTEYVDLSEYMESYVEAITGDKGIYQVAPFFAVYTLIGKSEQVGDAPGWSYEDFLQCLKPGQEIKNKAQQYDLLRILCYKSLEDYIDLETCEAEFDCAELREKLNFIKNYEYSSQNDLPFYEKLRSGEVMLAEAYLGSGNDYRIYQYAFGDDICAKGYPCQGRNGNYMELIEPMGISSRSKHQEVAWEFIAALMSEETGYENSELGFPSKKAVFERLANEWMGKDNGKNLTMTLFGKTHEVPYMKKEEMEDLRSMIASANRIRGDYTDAELILSEEAHGFLGGQISLDVALKNIDNRITLYLEEQK